MNVNVSNLEIGAGGVEHVLHGFNPQEERNTDNLSIQDTRTRSHTEKRLGYIKILNF
jgi:hypothetical protein